MDQHCTYSYVCTLGGSPARSSWLLPWSPEYGQVCFPKSLENTGLPFVPPHLRRTESAPGACTPEKVQGHTCVLMTGCSLGRSYQVSIWYLCRTMERTFSDRTAYQFRDVKLCVYRFSVSTPDTAETPLVSLVRRICCSLPLCEHSVTARRGLICMLHRIKPDDDVSWRLILSSTDLYLKIESDVCPFGLVLGWIYVAQASNLLHKVCAIRSVRRGSPHQTSSRRRRSSNNFPRG